STTDESVVDKLHIEITGTMEGNSNMLELVKIDHTITTTINGNTTTTTLDTPNSAEATDILDVLVEPVVPSADPTSPPPPAPTPAPDNPPNPSPPQGWVAPSQSALNWQIFLEMAQSTPGNFWFGITHLNTDKIYNDNVEGSGYALFAQGMLRVFF